MVTGEDSDRIRTTFNRVGPNLIGTIQDNWAPEALVQFRNDALETLKATQCKRLIIDFSGVDLLDAEDFCSLKQTAAMADLMGARTVIAGLKPGLVAVLIDNDVDLGAVSAEADLQAALNLD